MTRKIDHALRQASIADYDFLYKTKVLCLKDYVSAIWGWDEDFQQAHFSEHFNPADIQIIVVDGRDVGELSVQDNGDDLFLAGIYIHPDFQGQGLGTSVILDVIEMAKQSRRMVRLQVLKVNPARQLYERLGFRVIQATDTHFIMLWDKMNNNKS